MSSTALYLSRTAEFLQARIIQPGNHAPFVENFIMAGMLEPKRDGCHRPSQQPLPRAATSQGGLFLGIGADSHLLLEKLLQDREKQCVHVREMNVDRWGGDLGFPGNGAQRKRLIRRKNG